MVSLMILSVNKTWKNLLILVDQKQYNGMRPGEAKSFKHYKYICVQAYNLKV